MCMTNSSIYYSNLIFHSKACCGKPILCWKAETTGFVCDVCFPGISILCLMERCLWREVEQVEAVSRFSCRGLISVLSYASVSWSTKTRGWSWSWLTERNLSLRQHVVNKVNAEKSTKFKLRVTREKACFCLKPTTISSAAAPSWMC